ncbi:EamA-like transporter family protein [Roseivivax jejudonensis]|uniref:EamA-like transporter family protein n=1 Tax=Roseivivax jejudonensis TaxID=1529041 RepID=A0A1X6ZWN1_9RHOB|nr:DMT family transporter [Roseivivax jejudonensis]SLN63668.1 EamA-like transporter family protein [Roseivivax jejudonensis]
MLDGPALGQLLALGSATSFAVANNMISRTTRSGGDKGVMFSVLVTMGISGLLWLALEAGRTGLGAGGSARIGLAWFAFAGLMAMVFGRTLVFASIRTLGVARSTAVKRLNPFFSVLLAALILGEVVTGTDIAGMAAIAVSFAILIRESFARGTRVKAPPPAAYLLGVAAALAYAVSYIARKLGLETLPTPAFGTFVSAVSGFAVFSALALVLPRHRANFRQMFAHLDRWIVFGAVFVSGGQILLFAALNYESVSTVVMIASLEIFISILLSVLVFRSEARPGPPVLAAAGLATLGVVLVAAS